MFRDHSLARGKAFCPIFLLLASQFFVGCSESSSWKTELPLSVALTSNRRASSPNRTPYRLARASVHLHSALSYDACGSMSAEQCLSDLRNGLCKNHIDIAALTDHPSHMTEHNFSELVLHQPGDELLLAQDGSPIGNRIRCSDGHTITLVAGFESQLMPLGMTQHLEATPELRAKAYEGFDADLVSRLKNESNAIVALPHTEAKSKSVEKIASLNLDAIEIYNLHANINPTMRKNDLEMSYFKGLIDLLVYWVDPAGKQEPDLAFLSFLHVSPVYAEKWAKLFALGKKITGIGGNDAHQSMFPGTARDGDKLDSYRRLNRWITNHLLVRNLEISEIKEAIRGGRNLVVFEGLGSPFDFDFFIQSGTQFYEMGETTTLGLQDTLLKAHLPSLHQDSPQADETPTLSMKLIHVDETGKQKTLITTSNSDLSYLVTQLGAYRIEVELTPQHVKKFVGYHKNVTENSFKWIISNPIYVSQSQGALKLLNLPTRATLHSTQEPLRSCVQLSTLSLTH